MGRDDDFRAFMGEQWGGLVATAYLVTPDLEAAERSVTAAYAGMRRPWRWLLLRREPAEEALRRTVRAAMTRRPSPSAPIPAGEPVDTPLVEALRRLSPRARAAISLHFVRGLAPDVAGALIGDHPRTVMTHRAHGVPALAEAMGGDPAAVHARLTRLAGAAAAAAGPAPVDAVTTRARRLAVASVTSVVVLTVAVGVSGWLLRPGALKVAAGDGGPGGAMGRVYREGEPKPVPGPPFTLVYEDVPVVLPNPETRCGSTFAVSLHEPERVGRYPHDVEKNESRGDLVYYADCDGGTGSTRAARTVWVRDAGIGPEECATLLENETNELSMIDEDARTSCVVVEADPARKRPLLLVRLVEEQEHLGSALRWRATAWRGATELTQASDTSWQGGVWPPAGDGIDGAGESSGSDWSSGSGWSSGFGGGSGAAPGAGPSAVPGVGGGNRTP
jgi:hypothetical protein